MVVIIANYIPDAVRGKLKLWFIEPKPNVFVSGIRDSLADKVIELVYSHCPPSTGLLIFKDENKTPFYKIFAKGQPCKNISTISGLQLIVTPNVEGETEDDDSQHNPMNQIMSSIFKSAEVK